jgi:hypothetical protein
MIADTERKSNKIKIKALATQMTERPDIPVIRFRNRRKAFRIGVWSVSDCGINFARSPDSRDKSQLRCIARRSLLHQSASEREL